MKTKRYSCGFLITLMFVARLTLAAPVAEGDPRYRDTGSTPDVTLPAGTVVDPFHDVVWHGEVMPPSGGLFSPAVADKERKAKPHLTPKGQTEKPIGQLFLDWLNNEISTSKLPKQETAYRALIAFRDLAGKNMLNLASKKGTLSRPANIDKSGDFATVYFHSEHSPKIESYVNYTLFKELLERWQEDKNDQHYIRQMMLAEMIKYGATLLDIPKRPKFYAQLPGQTGQFDDLANQKAFTLPEVQAKKNLQDIVKHTAAMEVELFAVGYWPALVFLESEKMNPLEIANKMKYEQNPKVKASLVILANLLDQVTGKAGRDRELALKQIVLNVDIANGHSSLYQAVLNVSRVERKDFYDPKKRAHYMLYPNAYEFLLDPRYFSAR